MSIYPNLDISRNPSAHMLACSSAAVSKGLCTSRRAHIDKMLNYLAMAVDCYSDLHRYGVLDTDKSTAARG